MLQGVCTLHWALIVLWNGAAARRVWVRRARAAELLRNVQPILHWPVVVLWHLVGLGVAIKRM